MSEAREQYLTISEARYKRAWDTMIDVVSDSDHPEAESARQVLSVLASTSFDLQAELDRLTAERNEAAAAGWEAACQASNALNQEAQLTALLMDAKQLNTELLEKIGTMAARHAKELTQKNLLIAELHRKLQAGGEQSSGLWEDLENA